MKKILLSATLLSFTAALNAQIHFSENFDGVATPALGANFNSVDNDGDGNDWRTADVTSNINSVGNSAISNSWVSAGPLTPDNLLTSVAIDLTAATGSLSLSWSAGNVESTSNWWEENYDVIVTTSNVTADILAATPLFSEVLPSGGAMLSRSVDVSSFAGQTVYVTFRHHNCTDENYLIIDDVLLKNVLPNDIGINSLSLARYSAVSTNNQLGIDVRNNGSNTITSVDVDWNDGTAHSQTISVNIAPGATTTINHPDMVNYATAVEKNINVTITQVNGGPDSDPTDNTASTLHNTVSQIATNKVVFEEGTGTWCGWCPRGAVAMDYMYATYPNQFIGIAVHNGDPMTLAEYDNGAGFTGFPSSNIDRELLGASVIQSAWETTFNARKDDIIPAAISIATSGTGDNVVVDVTSTFYTPFANANYRLAVIIVEKGVTGTTSSYDQVNFYAGGSNGVMGGYESLPNPVPAAQMVYDHVGRALLGGYDGQANSVPTTITDGQVVTQQFTYTVPTTSTRWKMTAVAVLIDQTNGQIVSAEEVGIGEAGINELNAENVVVYPNPATNVLNVSFDANSSDYTIAVIDLQGRTVASANVSNVSGQQVVAIPVANLAKGSYLVRVSSNGSSTVQNVVIK